jgi:hypothetical protein
VAYPRILVATASALHRRSSTIADDHGATVDHRRSSMTIATVDHPRSSMTIATVDHVDHDDHVATVDHR